jgi:hypothetical protein
MVCCSAAAAAATAAGLDNDCLHCYVKAFNIQIVIDR